MKWSIVLLIIPVIALGCPKRTSVYEDTCVVDIQPETAPPVKPNYEKPPSEKMPSYERPGIKVIDRPSLTQQDEENDKQIADAKAQGKKLAGVK